MKNTFILNQSFQRALDFEKRRQFTLKVEASNPHVDPRFLYLGPFKDITTVRIQVEDVDEPPIFSRPAYILEVKEDVLINTVIGAVTARDPDSAKNPIKYSVDRHTDMDRIFNIDSGNGSIFTSKPLDREMLLWHNITVIAAEINNPKESSQVPVFIKVLDVNDNAPEFVMFYETFVCENAKAEQFRMLRVCYEDDDCTFLLIQQISFDGSVTVVLFAALRRQRKKEPLIISKEDIRDNIVSYNDEGGGEEDTQAFDIGTLRNPEAIEDNKLRRDIVPETLFMPRRTPVVRDNADVRDFISQRLKENDTDPTAPPYDSLATYAYEGSGSVADSLSSLESVTTDGDQDYDYLSDWGPRFRKLADMYGGEDSDKDS
ncbi:PREDICTED: cadherin-6-like [Thamnophis sirtalis]|uniref:Cadherin-6 n=1 Tax=Thamnophis sirtalis TaxID=35019 RepID=A0A6I9XQX1_9SAUR|nr:PREDICTED: cadherin-6-like [Thamnophis sirtalis]